MTFYVSENHPSIVSEEEWQQVQELMQYHKKQRNIQSGDKYQRRYPMSGMLVCPNCGKSLRRRYVYNRKVEWICSTYIQQGKEACKGIRVRDDLLTGLSFTEPMVVEEVFENGEKHYGYTSKRAYDSGERAADRIKEEGRSVLPRVNRSRRTVIEL
nr:zinc ribbon domain-containing protein [Acetivibrio ethanolgignens]